MKLKVVYHYNKDDEKCIGEYRSIEVFNKEKQEKITEFGDYYHDKGQEKVIGLVKGIEYITGEKVEMEVINKADCDY